MGINIRERTYQLDEVIHFQKNNEPYGELSNMSGLSLVVNGVLILTSEALYQVCKYPENQEAQLEIIAQKSPMAAKYKSRAYRQDVRADWNNVRVKVMRWCIRVKLAQNWDTFGNVLLSTEDRQIVELSKIDSFWGAKPVGNGQLRGENILGRLLMELREEVKTKSPASLKEVVPLTIPDFVLFGSPIGMVSEDEKRRLFPDEPTQLELGI